MVHFSRKGILFNLYGDAPPEIICSR